jgi:hypothetical protein
MSEEEDTVDLTVTAIIQDWGRVTWNVIHDTKLTFSRAFKQCFTLCFRY